MSLPTREYETARKSGLTKWLSHDTYSERRGETVAGTNTHKCSSSGHVYIMMLAAIHSIVMSTQAHVLITSYTIKMECHVH